MCDKAFPKEMEHACLLTPDRELMTDQGTDTTQVQCGEPVSFIGVAFRNRNDSKTAAPLRATPAGNIEHTAQPTGSSTGLRVSSLGASAGLHLFQTGWFLPL